MVRFLALILSLCLSVVTCTWSTAASSQPNLPESLLPAAGQTQIIINIPEFRLRYYVKGQLAYEAPVGVGKVVSQTELGNYFVRNKAKYPTWHPPDGRPPVPPGPKNPLGPRWMGLDHNSYGIHGTIAPSSIGHAVSMGCIRMRNEDVTKLFDMVAIGTPVKLAYERVFTSPSGTPESIWVRLLRDVYKKDASSSVNIPKGDIEARLLGFNLGQELDRVDKELFYKLLEVSDGEKVYLPFTTDLLINGQKVKAQAITYGGEVLIPLEPVASHLGLTVGFDDATRKPTVNGQIGSNVRILAGRAYLTRDNLEQLLGITASYVKSANRVQLKTYTVSVNGTQISEKAFISGKDGLMVPIRPICKLLNISLEWNAADGTLYPLESPEKKTSKYRILGGRAYINARLLEDFLGVLVGLDDIDLKIDVQGIVVEPTVEIQPPTDAVETTGADGANLY